MARVLLLNIFMFLLPFILYGAYFYLVRRGQKDADYWGQAPLGWLFSASILLVLIGIASLISFSGGSPEGTYVPPQFKDGVVVPGRIE